MAELNTIPSPEKRLGALLTGETDGISHGIDNLDFLFKIALAAYKVRAIQREYFRTRDLSLLNEAKIAERELDQLLREPAQGDLFQ